MLSPGGPLEGLSHLLLFRCGRTGPCVCVCYTSVCRKEKRRSGPICQVWVGSLQELGLNMTTVTGGDVVHHRVVCVRWGTLLRRRALDQRWTSYPWRAGSPAHSAHALLGSSLDVTPRMLEMNPASNMFCSVKPPALVAFISPGRI